MNIFTLFVKFSALTNPSGQPVPAVASYPSAPLFDGTGRDKNFSLRCVFVRSRQNAGRTTINVHAPPRTAAKFLLPSTPAASTRFYGQWRPLKRGMRYDRSQSCRLQYRQSSNRMKRRRSFGCAFHDLDFFRCEAVERIHQLVQLPIANRRDGSSLNSFSASWKAKLRRQVASTNSIRTALPNARATRETVDNLTSSA